MEIKEKYFTIDSDKLIEELVKQGYIEYLGTGDRYKDGSGLHNEYFKGDNSYNWEIMSEDTNDDEDVERWFYSLSNDFDIRESKNLLVLSKHIGTDIRGGYEDDIIYLKNPQMGEFAVDLYCMIHELKDELAVEDKSL